VWRFAARIRRAKLYTLPDLFDERFGRPAGLVPAILSAFIYAVPTLALQFVAMGVLFQTVFGIPLWLSLIIAWLLIYGYTMLGGLPSVIVTDTIQSVILFVGIAMMGRGDILLCWRHGADRSMVPGQPLYGTWGRSAGDDHFCLVL
jgi:Na+/proline symporter